jgi:hypothetical protein
MSIVLKVQYTSWYGLMSARKAYLRVPSLVCNTRLATKLGNGLANDL